MKRLDLVVGPNGAGKSTFVELTLAPLLPGSAFVNADEIAKQRWPDDPASHAYQAARVAAATRAKLIELGKSFIAESVFSHPSKLELIDAARAADYTIVLHVLLIPEELAVERVRHRVSAGGHDVPEDKIRERYQRLWALVAAAIARCDSATVYDNSGLKGPRIVAQMNDGDAIGSPAWPAWTPRVLQSGWNNITLCAIDDDAAATAEMTGDSVVPLIVNFYAFGAKDFDVKAALHFMLDAATKGGVGRNGYVERPGIDTYLRRGYLPLATTSCQGSFPAASISLEWSVDDFAISQFADVLGDSATAGEFQDRAQYWQNLFNPTTHSISPRNALGFFPEGPGVVSPGQGCFSQVGFDEGNAEQYVWYVPQNIAGLVTALGGRQAVADRLDRVTG